MDGQDSSRLKLAVGIAVAIIIGWTLLSPKPQPPAPSAPPPAPTAAAPPAPSTTPQEGAGPATPEATAPAAKAERAPEEKVTLESPKARFVLSSWGAALRDVVLKEKKFRRDPKDEQSGYQIIGTKTPETWPLRVTFPSGDVKAPTPNSWKVLRQTADTVVFRLENEAVALEKRFKLEGSYRLSFELVVENKTRNNQRAAIELHLFGAQDPAKKGGGFWDVASANVASLVCFIDDKAHRESVESAYKEPSEKGGAVRWAAADDKYFAVAAVPYPPVPPNVTCGRRGIDPLTGEAFLKFPESTIGPGAQTSYKFDVFAGPKYQDELKQVQPGKQDVHLTKVVDVTFSVLAAPLLRLLKLFYRGVGNWGLAIIMLTLFVKLLTFWPTQKAMLSGKKMQRLGPKLQELRKQYEGDRQRLGAETMALYKREGVSPLGGCLPTLITMPIWIALFSTLNYAVELHRAPFFGYIQDLSARDPYFITPLIMGGIMFLQMRMSPAGADPQQQKIMSVMMPIMFTSFSLFLPAGLAIYTLTNSALAILQQLYINRLDRKLHGPPPAAPSAPTPKRSEAPPSGGGGGKGKKHKGR